MSQPQHEQQPPQSLTSEQTHALFDILTHHKLYSEIEAFKSTAGVLTHGFPFRDEKQQARAAAASKTSSSEIAAPVPTSNSSSGGGGLTAFALSLWGRSGSSGVTPTPSAPDSPRVYTPQPPTPVGDDLSLAKSDGGSDGDGDEEQEDANRLSELPVMQLLTSTFLMRLPAIKTLPRDFWAVRVQGLLSRFADADLSESYDKGAMGARKTLASGSSAVLEMISRGFLGGVTRQADDAETNTPPSTEALKKKEYNMQDGRDLARAWDDVLDGLVYGDLVNDLYDHLATTDQLEAHSPAVEASSHYIVLHLAALLHHVFVRSPDGPYLMKLLDSVHGLIPYKMIKQTLRIGNAATMISGMMRLLLAKLSVTGLTNWLGVTQNDDDGMNLLQNIISMVLARDASEFKKVVQRIDKMNPASDDGAPTEEMLEAIHAHIDSPKSAHEALRKESAAKQESIVVAMLNARDPTLAETITDAQHMQCLQYYSALLSMRDREAMTNVLCRQPPDLFTKALKETVAAYNPIIRVIHERVDLGDHLQDLQSFITEFVRVSSGTRDGGSAATVEEYVKLLNGYKALLHKFVHSVGKSCPEVWRDFSDWSNASIVRFRQETTAAAASDEDAQGGKARGTRKSVMDESLNGLVSGLSEASRTSVLAAVDAHANYLKTLKEGSEAQLDRLASQIDSTTTTTTNTTEKEPSDAASSAAAKGWGPGVYLARWQDILDNTLITPAECTQPSAVRHGKEVRHVATLGKTGVAGGDLSTTQQDKGDDGADSTTHQAPDVDVVVRELGEAFGALMQAVNMERRVFGRR